MGTRSLTVIVNEHGSEIAVLYRQMDGYPTGHGQDLKDFLSNFAIVNGMTLEVAKGEVPKTANGMDCLAAQIVAHFKAGPGQFYLYPAGTRDACEEYVYTVYPLEQVDKKEAMGTAWATVGLKVEDTYRDGHVLYDGPVETFEPEKTG